MAKPEDTQCAAAVLDGDKLERCEHQIMYDEEADMWSRWCKKHTAQEQKAVEKGGERVAKFVEA